MRVAGPDRVVATKGVPVLTNGEPLPPISARDLDGNDVTVSELTNGSWSAVLFYRGHW
jgi:hypothetical protein